MNILYELPFLCQRVGVICFNIQTFCPPRHIVYLAQRVYIKNDKVCWSVEEESWESEHDLAEGIESAEHEPEEEYWNKVEYKRSNKHISEDCYQDSIHQSLTISS